MIKIECLHIVNTTKIIKTNKSYVRHQSQQDDYRIV